MSASIPVPSRPRAGLLSLVVPAYNESGAILRVLDEASAVLATMSVPAEIIVVDDASRDDTAALVATRRGVRLLENPVNLGYGHSLLRGIAVAKGDVIAICDADGSYDPAILPELLARIEKGVDHAIAARTGAWFNRPFLRRTVYRWLCQYVVGTRVPDANSGLRVFRREVVDSVRADLCLGFSFTTSLTLASFMSGYVTEFRPAGYRGRVGRSHVRFRDTLRTAQYLFQLVAAYNPLKLFFPLVVGLLAAGTGAALVGIWRGDLWFALASVFGLAAAMLTGVAAHAYIVARAGTRPIRHIGEARQWAVSSPADAAVRFQPGAETSPLER